MTTSQSVGTALDKMFGRDGGLYGTLEDLPLISQKGHFRRTELLARLDIGDVSRMTCVDFGIGAWGFGSVYSRLHSCARAIGIDISSHALELSRKLVAETRPVYADRFETLQSDGMTLPIQDSTVDLFFSGESIEHVRFPPRYLSEIHRVLADDGQLVITTPNRDATGWRSQGEEYCTSPEHFWLFNYAELMTMVSEFFDVREVYGFNGSFGPDLDRSIVDERRADEWCRQFEHEPQFATGVVLRATKKKGVTARYEIRDVPRDAIEHVGSDRYLPLEFGLEGLLLDAPGMSVRITRPPSDGMVCRMWSHRWSGYAAIEALGREHRVDLYTLVPGWKNWVCGESTEAPSVATVRPTLEKNPKSENSQVIFFEAFTWHRQGEGVPSLLTKPAAAPVDLALATPGAGFARLDPFVSTTLFLWFTPTTGNLRGPWVPLQGRQQWTGTADFWVEQLKQVMMANIDAIYVHCINEYEEQRVEFFKAYERLRRAGWDVPKLAPFLDPFGLWRDVPLDVATAVGKDSFVEPYIRFFRQYFDANPDPHAGSYLLRIDNRVVLTTWWVVHILRNLDALTRADVEQRLAAAFASRAQEFLGGIHMITTSLIDPDLTFSDERLVMFSGYSYAIHSVHNGIDAWHVQPGYWDQNIRRPGYLLPRDGGRNYRRAWDIVAANTPQRVYVESWNEYDEGSGIYAADPAGMFADPAMHDSTDVFSDRQDPYEYVRTTAAGAARVNGRPQYDARIIHCAAPSSAVVGETIELTVVARNHGNVPWRRRDDIGLAVVVDGGVVSSEWLNELEEEALVYDGVFRGRPVTFRVKVPVGDRRGTNVMTVSMTRGNTLFGEAVTLSVQIT
jgi:SAM-dependent methyltransferase